MLLVVTELHKQLSNASTYPANLQARNISVTDDFRPMQMLDQLKGKQAENLVGGLLTLFETKLVLHALRDLQRRFEAELATSKVGAACLDSLYDKKDTTCTYNE